jgi:ribosomal protein L12E/L44/L45/RPP1/RPP2
MSVIIKLLSKFDDSGLKKAKSGFGGLQKTLGAVGIGLGLGQIANYATNAVKGFEAAEIASSKLASVMKSMGVGMATERVDAYAESLQDLTAVDADIIKGAQTKLATFANLNKTIDKSGGAFDRATKASIDLAAAGFGSIEGNAVALGKALNDPIKGIASLTRNGITFTAKEKEKIKTLVEGNKILEAQDLVLQAIEKQVGGTAEAGVSVFEKMNRSMESVSDEVGKILLPYMKDFANFLLKDVVPNVKSFLQDLSNPDTEAGKTFVQIKDAVTSAYNGVRDFFALFGNGDAMKGFANIVTSLVQALPALLALKGIMMLASGGKAIANLVTAMSIIAGKTAPPVPPAAVFNPATAIVASQVGTYVAASAAQDITNKEAVKKGVTFDIVSATFTGSMALPRPLNPQPGDLLGLRGNRPTTVNINVTKADPKATVDALSAYLKQNGSLPSQLFWNARN